VSTEDLKRLLDEAAPPVEGDLESCSFEPDFSGVSERPRESRSG